MKYKYTFECEIPDFEYFKKSLEWDIKDKEELAERISENLTYEIVQWWSDWDSVKESATIEE